MVFIYKGWQRVAKEKVYVNLAFIKITSICSFVKKIHTMPIILRLIQVVKCIGILLNAIGTEVLRILEMEQRLDKSGCFGVE